mmetsp:Transcript_97940/g.165021  ORF Transcript_97940/g.165021 Transcript_97940/m.165021 type:complete len:109 (+) Transcript_97940:2093-2419(+)
MPHCTTALMNNQTAAFMHTLTPTPRPFLKPPTSKYSRACIMCDAVEQCTTNPLGNTYPDAARPNHRTCCQSPLALHHKAGCGASLDNRPQAGKCRAPLSSYTKNWEGF